MIGRLTGAAAIRRADDIAGMLAAAFASSSQRWSADSVAGTLAAPGTVAYLARAGCALLRLAADEAEILTVAVLPGARRQGVAGRLVGACLAEAAAAGATSVHLEVGEGNAAARALYARAGFREVGRRKAYYEGPNGREDALLMSRELVAGTPARAPA